MTFEEMLREEYEAGWKEGFEEGFEEGWKEGFKEGFEESLAESAEGIMAGHGLSVEEACTIVGLPIEKYRAYKKKDGAGE